MSLKITAANTKNLNLCTNCLCWCTHCAVRCTTLNRHLPSHAASFPFIIPQRLQVKLSLDPTFFHRCVCLFFHARLDHFLRIVFFFFLRFLLFLFCFYRQSFFFFVAMQSPSRGSSSCRGLRGQQAAHFVQDRHAR